MARDRLAELQSLQNESGDDVDDTVTDEETVFIEIEPRPEDMLDKFFDKVKLVRDTMGKLDEKIHEVKQRQADLIVKYSAEEKTDITDEVRALMDQISTFANKIRNELKIMEKQNKSLEQDLDGEVTSALRMRKNQHSTLSRKFISTMTEYNENQQEHDRRLREHMTRQIKIAYKGISDDEVEKIIEQGCENTVFTGTRLREAEEALAEINARHDDIIQLEESLKELHEMFLDMAILVGNQGEIIDRIEHSVAESQDYVRNARLQTKKAEQLQTSARKKQIWLGICCLVLIGIIVIVLATQIGKSSK